MPSHHMGQMGGQQGMGMPPQGHGGMGGYGQGMGPPQGQGMPPQSQGGPGMYAGMQQMNPMYQNSK